jgi:hypothetical protein
LRLLQWLVSSFITEISHCVENALSQSVLDVLEILSLHLPLLLQELPVDGG